MPPKAVRTVRDLIYWQYAKLIAESAGYGKTRNYGFIMDRFKQLKNGGIQWSGSIREYVKEREKPNECIYCGGKEALSTDHLIPKSRGGPDTGGAMPLLHARGATHPKEIGVFTSGTDSKEGTNYQG